MYSLENRKDTNRNVADVDVDGGIPGNVVEEARRGRPWWQLPIKQKLNSQLSADVAFEEFRKILHLPASLQLQWKPIRSLQAAAACASDYLEIELAGEAFVNFPPAVLGRGNHRLLRGTTRSLYVAAFSNAAVRGRSGLIEIEDFVLLDFERDELNRIHDELELDIAVFRAGDQGAYIISDGDEAHFLHLKEAFSLLGPNSFAFGHWMAEYLPKVIIALESGILREFPVLIDAEMPQQHRQALESLLPDGISILEVRPMQIVRVEKLWCAPTIYYAPVAANYNDAFDYGHVAVPPARSARVIRAMLAKMVARLGPALGERRIFLARKPERHRKLLNYEAIESIAEAHSFERIYPEELDFIDQVRALRSARFVVGPEGSAFFLAHFARPGTKLCILNHPHTVPLATWTSPMAALGIETTVLTGPFRRKDIDLPHSDFEIDETAFSKFLDGWLEYP